MNIFVRSHLSALERAIRSPRSGALGAGEASRAEEPAPRKAGQGCQGGTCPRASKPSRLSGAAQRPKWRRSRPRSRPRRPRSWRRSSWSDRFFQSRRRWSRPEPRRACPRPVQGSASSASGTEDGEVATEEEAVNGGAPEARSSGRPSAARCDEGAVHPPRVQRPAPTAPRGPKPVFSSSAPATPARPSGGPSRPGMPSRPGGDRNAPPVRTFGPDAEKGGGRKKGKKGKRSSVDQEAVHANILKTLQGMKGPAGRKGRRSDEPSFRDVQAGRLAEEKEREKTLIRVNEFVSVSELAGAMKVPATQIVQFAFKELGLMVTVNQRLDFDQIELIASAFGFQAVKEDEYAAEAE